MSSGVIQGQARLPRLMLALVLMICSGCSLGLPPPGSSAVVFEGPPAIQIASPLPNQTFLAGTTVIVQARIENAGPDLTRVSVLLDNAVVGETLNPNETGAEVVPLTIDWPTSNPGQYEIAVAAERGDGASARETVTVSVIRQADLGSAASEKDEDESGQQPPSTATSDSAAVASETSSSTMSAPIASQSPPTAKVLQVSNLRAGPSTAFDPPVGSIAANQEVEIVAVSEERDWYKIRYADGEAWIYADLVSTAGDTASLPLDAGPPPANPVNLVVRDIVIEPHPMVCGETGQIQVIVHNEGTDDTESGGWVRVQAILKRTGEALQSIDQLTFPSIRAGDDYTVTASLQVDVHYNETQIIRVTIDSGEHIPEGNEDDNVRDGVEYPLVQGSCG